MSSKLKAPPNAPLHSWIWPNRPWSCLHIDHAGPFMEKLFLVVVDAHSKWLEVKIVPSTSSQATIHALRSIFAIHGLPDVIFLDNGTAFTTSSLTISCKRMASDTSSHHPTILHQMV